MRKRGSNEGSIFQRVDGRWCAQVTVWDKDGRRRLVSKYATTQGQARRLLTGLKSKQDAHRLVVNGKTATVRAWLDTWLHTFIKPGRAPRTYRSYYGLLKEHIPERLGALPLTKLAPETLQQHFTTITAGGLGRTGELLRAVLRSAFNKAVRLHHMESNPVLGTDPVKYLQQEARTFTAEEGRRFLDAAEDDRLGALFIIALSLGLRKGEVIGLKAMDIDLDQRIIHVRRSLAWVKLPGDEQGKWIEREPKRGSFRDLPITETIFRALVRRLARRQEEAMAAGEKWKDSGYLFVSVLGGPLHERNVSEAFHRVCDRANVPRIRFHDTRHSCGTLLHVQGADPFIIQRVLGHSQLSTTRRYTHVPIQVTKTALDGLESLFKTATKAADPELVTVSVTVKPEPKPM
jgi:integrase